MTKERAQFNRELPQKTLAKIKALAERFQTTDAQAVIFAIDQIASQEKLALFHKDKAKSLLGAVPAYQLQALKSLLEGGEYDKVALTKLKTSLGKGKFSDFKFREYVIFDLDIDTKDFEVC